MGISAFQIFPSQALPFPVQAETLDNLTRELPQGFYTTFTTLSQGTKVFGLRTHLNRLYIPSRNLGLSPSVNMTNLRTLIAEIVRVNLPKESRVRVILTKDKGMIFVVVQPIDPLPISINQDGVNVITADLSRHAPRIKDTGFISASMDQRKQVGGEIFEVLLTKNGQILEGMTSNFYAIDGKALITASRGILLGVTRRVILQLARGRGMSIEYRAPFVDEKINEAFLTSSSRGVVPIISIDKTSVGQGRVGKWTKMLSQAYHDYIEERSEFISK